MNESFCSPGEVARARRNVRRKTGIWAGAGIALALGFIALCLSVRTGNARTLFTILLATMIPGGIAVLTGLLLSVRPARRLARHLEGLATQTPTVREGRLTLDGEPGRVPGSVWFYPAKLETAEGTVRLNVEYSRRGMIPPDGTWVRVETARKFITRVSSPDGTALPGRGRQPGTRRWMAGIVGELLPLWALWAFAVLIFGGFVFNRITDAPAEKKLTLWVDGEIQRADELAERLEKGLDGAVSLVQVHPFSYAMFDSNALRAGDLYLVPASRAAEYGDWYTQPPAGLDTAGAEGIQIREDLPPGFRMSGCEALLDSLSAPQDAEGPWLLFFGSRSLHLPGNPGAVDDAAAKAAGLLLNMK